MKKLYLKIFTLLLILSVSVSCAIQNIENDDKAVQNARMATRSGDGLAWDYPIKPGSKEWAALKSGREKVEACQIPIGILARLSTKELAEICMNYPMYFEFTAYDDEKRAISRIIERFNGLSELSKRESGTLELINIYRDFPVTAQVQSESAKNLYTPITIKLPFLELLLADDAFAKQIDSQMAIELEKIVLDKYVRKLENNHIFSLWNIKRTFLLGAVTMNYRNKFLESSMQHDVIKRFIENYNHLDPTLITEVSKIISEI